MLTQEQKLKLQTAGYSPEKIAAYEQAKGGTQEEGYLDRLGSSYKKRAENIISDVKRPGEVAAGGGGFLDVLKAEGETALRTAGNVAGAAFDPITTALEPVVKPIIQGAAKIPGVKQVVQKGTELAEKYPNAAKDVGAALDIVSLGGGKIAEQGVKGLAEGAAKGAGKIVAPAGKALKGAGEAAYGLTVPMEEATSKALLNYQAQQGSLLNRIKGELTGATKGTKPITEANTAARYGLVGTEREIGIQAKQYQEKLWSETLKPKLSESKEIVDMRDFISELEDQIVAETPELGRKNALLEALDAFKSDYKNVGKIGGTKLQEYKSGWAEFIPDAYYKDKPIAAALKDVRAKAAAKARQTLYDTLGEDAKQAYLDYGNLESIVKAGIKAPVGDAANKSFGRNVWEFVMDKAVTPIATMGGKILYKTGDGLEFLGKSGAKKVGDIIQK